MSLINGFDANKIPKGDAIPEGTQAVCLVTECVDKESKNTPGNWMVSATIEVVEGEFKGTRVYTNFNIKSSSVVAERICKSQLASLCLAVGCPRPNSNSELLNKPFRATFAAPQEFNGEQQSRIQKYDPVGGSAGVVGGLGQQFGAAVKPAWAK